MTNQEEIDDIMDTIDTILLNTMKSDTDFERNYISNHIKKLIDMVAMHEYTKGYADGYNIKSAG